MRQSPAGRFVAELARLSQAAEDAAGVVSHWYAVAGLLLEIRYAGPQLQSLIDPALAHLRVAASGQRADLILSTWDCEGTGVPYPQSPVGKEAFWPRGDIRQLSDGPVHTAYSPHGRLLSVIDLAAGQGFYCVGNATQIPRFEAAEPIRALLSWLMRAHGRQLVHAAAVGNGNGAALLIGRSGAGKSNTSLTCLAAGLDFLADDFCAVSAGGAPMVHSLYCTAKTTLRDSQRNPYLNELAPHLDPTGRDKTIHYLQQAVPQSLVASRPLKVLLKLQQGPGACRLGAAAPAQVLAAMAPDTAGLLANAGPEVLRTLGRLVRALPCYTLHLGSDARQIAATIGAVIDDPGKGGDGA